MTAIPKFLAMANPKLVISSVAAVAGAISSKFAIDAVYEEENNIIEFPQLPRDDVHPFWKISIEEWKEVKKCMVAWNYCKKGDKPETECDNEYDACIEAIRNF